MTKKTIVIAFIAYAAPLFAVDTSLNVLAAYYPPNHCGYEASGFVLPDYSPVEGNDAPDARRNLGSDIGSFEAKAIFSIAKKVPILAGDIPLLSDNNIRGLLNFELSPVSVNGIGQFSLTPIAFLVFDGGAGIGTGWSSLGLGINPEGNGESEIETTSFGGAVWRVWGAATFQFDLAAIIPGEWHHLLALATAKVEYKAYTGADDGEAWLWEGDVGENFNGAKFYGTYALAYQMPRKLDLVGVMFESREWIGDVRSYSTTSDEGGWGSDFRTWQVSALGNIALTKKDSLLVLFQLTRAIDWTDSTTRNRDFRTRDYDGAYWYFDRVGLSYTHLF